MSDPLKARLKAGIAELGLAITETQTEQLLTYLQEFHKWNRAYNLSAVRDIDAMLDRHLLDSLSVLAHVQARTPRRLIDVGTGGGLPGIPLAIALPDCQITLLDSNGKKTRFLFHVKTLLKLNNVAVENRRVEQFRPDQPFDIVISRAFASLADMVSGCEHLLAPEGLFMAMKGVYPEAELAEIEGRVTLVSHQTLAVPGVGGSRCVLELRKAVS
ncbi:16S rRNA (guanine(527)-N(7))-methyltransferase RsmG [Marinimicrobium sp. C6131]|uniref:16S rRNA (guanine(527)-N(7))-methyltransferase RsmG n=1 Tax=Marinimicrobium sp. C6131 TaxID=3022676 RepID=UPI00223D94C0|nr:16S rRNA (guanine(527)-N(7))-methyltransferase RsmG [Marinimicrobium sp. C6131]UZJ43750.1 16S rRNA (guanine(527)-N(7))-methyltransferase RsmG [Marinimicrobium sp. C6131]